LSLANNHIWDWGREALGDTLALVESKIFLPLGAGTNYTDANAPKFFEFKDGTRLALFAYTNLMPRSLEATETKSA